MAEPQGAAALPTLELRSRPRSVPGGATPSSPPARTASGSPTGPRRCAGLVPPCERHPPLNAVRGSAPRSCESDLDSPSATDVYVDRDLPALPATPTAQRSGRRRRRGASASRQPRAPRPPRPCRGPAGADPLRWPGFRRRRPRPQTGPDKPGYGRMVADGPAPGAVHVLAPASVARSASACRGLPLRRRGVRRPRGPTPGRVQAAGSTTARTEQGFTAAAFGAPDPGALESAGPGDRPTAGEGWRSRPRRIESHRGGPSRADGAANEDGTHGRQLDLRARGSHRRRRPALSLAARPADRDPQFRDLEIGRPSAGQYGRRSSSLVTGGGVLSRPRAVEAMVGRTVCARR